MLARQWRPSTFCDVVGQKTSIRILTNALSSGRLHHAYLFTGTRGVGKTTIARILAACMNCEQGIGAQPCGQCNACVAIRERRFVDLIEVDAASRTKVEDTRELLDNVQYAPTAGRFKIYLIDEVHMLSTHSFNALLKTLEEPPPHVKFLLATTDPQKLPATILSRCLQFHLKAIAACQITDYLQQQLAQTEVTFEIEALQILSRAAAGSLRDALSLVDQAIAYGANHLSASDVRDMLGILDSLPFCELIAALAQADATTVFAIVTDLSAQAIDYQVALETLLSLLHRIAIAQVVPGGYCVDDEQDSQSIQALAQTISVEDIQLFYQLALHARRDLTFAPNPRDGFEMALLRMLAFKPAGVVEPPTQPTVKLPESSNTHVKGVDVSVAADIQQKQNCAMVTDKNELSPENWLLYLDQWQLDGMLGHIALHCVLDRVVNQHYYFTMDERHSALLSDRYIAELQERLSKRLQKDVKVTVAIGPTKTQTPAAIKNRQRSAEQQRACDIMRADPHVKNLIEAFDATLDEQLIKGASKN